MSFRARVCGGGIYRKAKADIRKRSIALKCLILRIEFLFPSGNKKNNRFQNLPIFSPVEPFWIKNKFFNFFDHRAEKMCIFAPLFEKP